MSNELLILLLEAMIMYFLVLAAHSLRHRFGPVHFYALIGGVTAIMSWVTDAGLVVEWRDITFVVGSTVFYTSLLLGVFVVYVFDGPRATRVTISTIVGVSIIMPLIAAALHLPANLIGAEPITTVPLPSLRINTASVLATLIDLIFLGIAWEFLGKPRLHMGLWFRTWLTLLGVMWLDVVLFATGAFAGTPAYVSVMQGTLVSRFFISLVALPLLYAYLYWQSNVKGITLENRPVLAILSQVAEIEAELSLAQKEIERRKRVEKALQEAQAQLIQQERLAAVGQLTTGVAHVFNNLLAGIMLRVQMAQKSPSGDESKRQISLVYEQLQDGAALVEKMLDFSRKGLIKPEPVDLAAWLKAEISEVRLTLLQGQELSANLPELGCEVQVDRARMSELLHNLVSNAQAALPNGGAVHVSLSFFRGGGANDGSAENSVICSGCRQPIAGQWVRLAVSDEGAGMSRINQTRAFEPFFTTRGPQHQGLGLSQVLGIVEQHEGHLTLESEVGRGTTVAVYLPYS